MQPAELVMTVFKKKQKAMLFRIASRTVPPYRESGGLIKDLNPRNMNEGDTFKTGNL